jgi:hypothetical protein
MLFARGGGCLSFITFSPTVEYYNTDSGWWVRKEALIFASPVASSTQIIPLSDNQQVLQNQEKKKKKKKRAHVVVIVVAFCLFLKHNNIWAGHDAWEKISP